MPTKPEKIKQAAAFSKVVYKPSTNKREKVAQKYGATYDSSLSSKKTAVFVNPKSKAVIVSHRGTKDKSDILPDIKIAFGAERQTKRIKQAKKNVQEVREAYPTYNITNVGHSLGGLIAERVGRSKEDIITFGKASGLGEPLHKRKPKQKDYRSKGDIISLLSVPQLGGKLKQSKASFINPFEAHQINSVFS